MDAFECPWCHQEMVCGSIFAPSGHCAYWTPDGTDINGILTVKRVERAGGFVIDAPMKVGFVAKSRPETWHCPRCNMLVTKLFDDIEHSN